MRNTAPHFLQINPDGLTTLRMPVIPTIRLLFVIWTNAPFLLHSRGLDRYYNFIFAGRKISREENFAKLHSQWILFSRVENFAQNPISSTRKIGVIQYTQKCKLVTQANACLGQI